MKWKHSMFYNSRMGFVAISNLLDPIFTRWLVVHFILLTPLRIMRQKAMDKEVAKQIRKNIRKGKKEKQVKKTLTMLIVFKRLT